MDNIPTRDEIHEWVLLMSNEQLVDEFVKLLDGLRTVVELSEIAPQHVFKTWASALGLKDGEQDIAEPESRTRRLAELESRTRRLAEIPAKLGIAGDGFESMHIFRA